MHLDTHEINWHGCWIWYIYDMCWIKVFKNNNIFTFKWKLLVIELLPNLGGWYTLSDIWDKCIGYLRLLWLLKPVKLWKGRCLVMTTFKLCLIHFLRNFGYKMLVHLFVLGLSGFLKSEQCWNRILEHIKRFLISSLNLSYRWSWQTSYLHLDGWCIEWNKWMLNSGP